MKKFLCLFGALALLISSCSSNDDHSEKKETAILPKTIKFSMPNDPAENVTSTIIYNGKKIVSITDEEERTDFTYQGNFIVKAITYDITDGSSDKKVEQSYSYTNGKLTSTLYAKNFTAQYPFGEFKNKFVYSYNPDGTVKKETYSINNTTAVESKNAYTEVFTFQNGNLVKIVASEESSLSPVRTSIYEFDTKNNPFKNVLGFDLLIDDVDYGNGNGNANNVTRHTYSYLGSGDTSYSNKTAYEYNANGFPTKQTDYKQDGVSISEITEYAY